MAAKFMRFRVWPCRVALATVYGALALAVATGMIGAGAVTIMLALVEVVLIVLVCFARTVTVGWRSSRRSRVTVRRLLPRGALGRRPKPSPWRPVDSGVAAALFEVRPAGTMRGAT